MSFKILKNKKFLITGGSGFIGTNLINNLMYYSNQIINIDLLKPKINKHKKFWIKVDINNYDKLNKICNKFRPDYIINLAAKTDLNGKNLNYYKTNFKGVENLIKCSLSIKKLKKILFFSSRLVCKIGYQPKNFKDYCPSTIYGKSKVLGEKILNSKKYNNFKKWSNIRVTSLWGPWFDVPYKNFFLIIKRGLYFNPTNKKIYKSFGYVENSIFQIKKLLICNEIYTQKKNFYLADFEPIEINKFANKIANTFNSSKPKNIPFFLLNVGAVFGDILKLFQISFPITTFRLNNLKTNMIHDTNDLKKISGPLPYSVNKGIRKTVKWINKHNA